MQAFFTVFLPSSSLSRVSRFFPLDASETDDAGKPDSLSNCSILNQTFDMFQVSCSEGFDGGLPQEFVSEVYMMGHKNLFAYVNSK
jgi:hypothetical protein